MAGINMSSVISANISRLGRECVIVKSSGDEQSVVAMVQPIWRRSKSRFEGSFTEIGELVSDYCMYIGPSSFDITTLSKNDTVYVDDRAYYFEKADKCVVGGRVQYCNGVLKRIYKEDSNDY